MGIEKSAFKAFFPSQVDALKFIRVFPPPLLTAVGETPATLANVDVQLDRSEMNRQLGLDGQAGAFIANLLESQSGTSISSLISDCDLADNEEDSDGNEAANTSTSVSESVKQACSGEAVAVAAETAAQTDWPLNEVCVRLLADLWDCRWETRHGAASGLRELLAFPAHTRQAGARNGVSEAEVG